MLKKLSILFSFIFLFVLLSALYYNNKVKEQKIDTIMDQVKLTLDLQLKLNEMDDLKIVLLLAYNTALVEALENDDEDTAYILLSDMMKSIKKNTNTSIRAQIITQELNILARSWNDIYTGMPIGDYRKDLEYFKKYKEPRTSIEIGRRIGFKATVPIYKNDNFLGYIEVVSFFRSTTEYLSSLGVDLYVLLDIEYADDAILMRNNLVIDKYILSNIDYNYGHIQTLNKIDFNELIKLQVLHMDGKYIFYKIMYDGLRKPIGKFVFVLPQRYVDYFRNPEDDISYLINITRGTLYNIVKRDYAQHTTYNDYKIAQDFHLKGIMAKEDKEVFLEKAYNILNKYPKDELIQIMLKQEIVHKIDGKIR